MSNFKVGQKVVCIDDSAGFVTGTKGLIINEIYTVAGIRNYSNGFVGIFLEERPFDYKDWNISRFRPLDHAFGKRIAAEITEKVKQEQLIEAL